MNKATKNTDLRCVLYPAIEPYNSGFLQVDDSHRLYYEECGNPLGKPAVLLHGGPGSGCSPAMRSFHNPEIYRIILFDQRGSGRSTPKVSLQDNTTWDLVSDIEMLRTELQIEKWQVFGGSWGSTLALAYAESHPDRVSELVLRGIFLGTQAEQDWIYKHGASELFPKEFRDFIEPIPRLERSDMPRAYYQRLLSFDEAEAQQLAQVWSTWEAQTSCLLPNEGIVNSMGSGELALAIARIECHFFTNDCFLEDDQLIRDVDKIRKIPGVIVNGRYDALCPPVSAYRLSRAWPEVDLRIVPDAGHSAFETGNIDQLVRATDRFAT